MTIWIRTRRLTRSAAAAGILLAAFGTASADLKFTLTVSASGGTDEGLPASGKYEVDYRADSARVVEPNGRIAIYDFKKSQIDKLDPTTKTYYSVPFADASTPSAGSTRPVYFARDPASPREQMFGGTGTRFYIGLQPFPAANNNPNYGRRRGGNSPSPNPATNAIGATWVVDSAGVRASFGSALPLVAAGVPKALVSSVVQQMDSAGDIPVNIALRWSRGISGNSSVSMQVTAVDTAALDASKFAIPTDYKLVPKPAAK